MSVKAMTWAFEQPLSGNDKVVLLAVADHADDNGFCWPSIERIKEKAHVSRRTVVTILSKLESLEYLSIDRGAGRTTSKYQLNLRRASSAPVQPAARQTCNQLHGRRAAATAPKPSSTVNEPSIISAVCAVPGRFYETDFEKFWVAFPQGRKRGKGECRKKFKKLIEKTGIDPDVLIDAARLGNGIDPAFPPMPATWLNQGRWEDDPQQSSSKPTPHQNNMKNLREIIADDEHAARETENHSNPAGLLADNR